MPQITLNPYTQAVDTVAGFCTALDAAVISLPDAGRLAEFLFYNSWDFRAQQLLALTAPAKCQAKTVSVI